jgi:fructose-1,6-bisphosphatase/inositol monophosphatase family enzyme
MESSDFDGEAWIANPMRQEYFFTSSKLKFVEKSIYYGEVSRWEFDSGLYDHLKSDKFKINPLGSIAYKLARLSAGEIDFVVSLKPKNIWDIAAGVILCNGRGLNFYSEGKKVDKVQSTYNPPLIWCSSDLAPELLKIFS